jgi:hypothetical protein
VIIETRYDIGQAVTLTAIKWPATVVAIELVGKNLLYNCSYWADFEQRFTKVAEEEIANNLPEGGHK